jgi:hypothetical protein
MTTAVSATSGSNTLSVIGVRGEASGLADVNYGGYFTATTPGTGGCTLCEVSGINTSYAIYATASGDGQNYSGYFDAGDFRVNGFAQFNGATEVNSTFTVNGALNGFTQVTQAADQDVTNASLTDSDTLTISTTAGKIYAIDAVIIAGGNNATGDYIFDFAVAAGTMDCTGTEQSVTTADAIQSATVIATAAADTTDTSVGTRADASLPIAIRITLACKVSNTTTLKYRFGNAAASAGRTSRTMAGSFLKWKQLN